MHVALVSPAWPPSQFSNGIVTYVAGLQRGLMAQGHRVTILTPELGVGDFGADVRLVPPPVSRSLASRLRGAWRRGGASEDTYAQRLVRAVGELHEHAPLDILEMEETFGVCGDVASALSMPVVAKLHGPAFLDLVGDARSTPFAHSRIDAERAGLRKVRFITSPAAHTLEATLVEYGLTPQQSEVIANPMEFDDQAGVWSAACSEPATILFVGRFDKRKGGDLALLLLKTLLPQRPDTRLVFIGPNYGWPGEAGKTVKFADFAAACLTPSEREQVVYLDQMPRSDVFAWRQRATLTLVLSRWDNQPNTALEAMMQGCPVVAVAAGGVPEIIEAGRTGLLAKPGDLGELAAQCLRIIDEPQFGGRLGTNARNDVRARHAPDLIAKQTAAFYQRCLAG